MNRFRYKLYEFMQGRRGMDALNQFLMKAALILLVAAFIFRRVAILYVLTYYGGLLLLFYGYYRMLSRNLYKREMENNRFLAWKYKRSGNAGFQQQTYHGADFERYVYFKCPSCGQKMRAPRKKGRIRVQCHSCGTSFEKKV
ncbi:MAG: hypothetical protein IKJ77_02825 [Firmicutes bacterium]|nr:hypothetical protein [Bacillota bacterium]